MIYPPFPFWSLEQGPRGNDLPGGFRYASDANTEWLDADQIREMAALVPAAS